MQNAGKPVDAVDVDTTWQSLVSRPGAQLIDVRTRAEWTYVGIPDLGAIGKRAVLVEWQTFPDQAVDPRFVERLAGELRALGAQLNDDLFFICRSGGRSLAAAKAMAEAAIGPAITSPAVLKVRSTTIGNAAPLEAGRRPVCLGVRARDRIYLTPARTAHKNGCALA